MSGSRGAPEETPFIKRERRVEMTPAEKSDPGTETTPVSLRGDSGDDEVELAGMKRPICAMQGQKTADESRWRWVVAR